MDARPRCPGCGGSLTVTYLGHLRRYGCDGCGATLMGIAALRQVLADGVAQQIWTSDGATQATPGAEMTCPFCRGAMLPRPVEAGRVSVCRPCEVVWLEQAALDGLPAAPPPRLGTVPAVHGIPRCPNCGAPVESSYEERCRYCGTATAAPSRVVVLPEAHA